MKPALPIVSPIDPVTRTGIAIAFIN